VGNYNVPLNFVILLISLIIFFSLHFARVIEWLACSITFVQSICLNRLALPLADPKANTKECFYTKLLFPVKLLNAIISCYIVKNHVHFLCIPYCFASLIISLTMVCLFDRIYIAKIVVVFNLYSIKIVCPLLPHINYLSCACICSSCQRWHKFHLPICHLKGWPIIQWSG
jgi:hypothetical protein